MNIPTDDSGRQHILRRALVEIREMRAQLATAEKWRRGPVAIIGFGCRFPGGADGPEAFWQLLSQGVDAITDVPPERWDLDAWFDADPSTPGKMYTRSGGFLAADVGGFDAGFFHISPREVTTMDPQQRMLLEVAWEALEHANQPAQRVADGDVGVFIGISTNDYAQLTMFADPAKIELYTATGNALNAAAGRLSYVFGFHGPAMAIDTACSSSLVTVHLACQSLRNRECRVALAGGVSLILTPDGTLATCRARMMAPDGRCKTFDTDADGYVRGEGCGLVVLKCLSDAIADGDRILAVIRGSAVNQDGASGGLTVPNGVAQRALMCKALANAGVEPAAVSCIEAHGTGTTLGDPIEVEALQAVYAANRSPDRPLIVGSVKTNIGHLEAAAGVAGLIKVVLALQHGEIPPHLHLKALNPHIQLDPSVVIPTAPRPWPRSDLARLAAVSSFGFTGTNAHVIVEEAPAPGGTESGPGIDRPLHVVMLSGRSAEALTELAGRYRDHVPGHPDQSLGDIGFTANAGRSHFAHRVALVAATREDLIARLTEVGTGGEGAGVVRGQVGVGERPRVAFLFTGQGSQYAGMGRGLYETQPVFRAALDHCAEVLRQYLQEPLLSLLYEPGRAPELLDQTGITQPALFALEYALAELWRSWGIEPAVVLGHSVGEYVAACVAGVFRVDEGLALVARRGQLMQALPAGGAMAAALADEEQVAAALARHGSGVSIAAVNGPSHVVIAGAGAAVAGLCQVLQDQGIRTQALRVSHAFHSALMEPMLAEFAQVAAGVEYRSPRLRLISNVSGKVVEGGTTLTADYWVRHVREAVRFHDGLKTLQEQGCRLVLEIGPQPTLLALGQECPGAESAIWLASLRRGRDDWAQMLDSLARLYVQGCEVDWDGFDRPYHRRRLALPTYPFQRKRYWAAAPTASKPSRPTAVLGSTSHPYLGHRVLSPLEQIQFEAAFSLRTLPLVGDHRILGMPWLNLVLYLEMAAAAAIECHGGGAIVLKDVAVLRPLILREDESRPVHLVLSRPREGAVSFEIHGLSTGKDGRVAGNGTWLLHAQGSILLAQEGEQITAADQVRLDDMRTRCADEISRKEFYAAMEQHGIWLGPSCRWLDRLWRGEGEALGRIRPARPGELDRRYVLDLGAIDACFQLLSGLLPPNSPNDYVLSGLQSFHFWSSDRPLDLWADAVLVAHDETAGALTADVSVFDETGRIVAAIGNARLQRVGVAAAELQTQHSGESAAVEHGPQLLIEDLLAAPREQAQELLVEYLTAMLGQSLGVPVSDINANMSLATQIDSLVAVEMKTQIERNLDVAVPVAAFFDGNSIRELAGTLCGELKNLEAAASGDEIEDLFGEIERMSDDEARARMAAQWQANRERVAHE